MFVEAGREFCVATSQIADQYGDVAQPTSSRQFRADGPRYRVGFTPPVRHLNQLDSGPVGKWYHFCIEKMSFKMSQRRRSESMDIAQQHWLIDFQTSRFENEIKPAIGIFRLVKKAQLARQGRGLPTVGLCGSIKRDTSTFAPAFATPASNCRSKSVNSTKPST